MSDCTHPVRCPDCGHEWDQECDEYYTNCPGCGKRWATWLDEITYGDDWGWCLVLIPEEEGLILHEPAPTSDRLIASHDFPGGLSLEDGDSIEITLTTRVSAP